MKKILTLFLALSFLTAYSQKIKVIISTADGKHKLAEQVIKPSQATISNPIIIHPEKAHQQIIGFGGTYSEATAHNLKRLSEAKRKEVLQAFFDVEKGAGWNILRTTINSCDASSEYYSYDETDGDIELKNFGIQKDIDNYIIPGLQAALRINPQIKIFASPWTPPVWMKDSREFNNGSLLPKYYSTWAHYFSKYIAAYRKEGINLWAVTPQNEPEAYRQAWDACGWKPEQMSLFVGQHLGPRLKQDHPAIKIIGWDHNKNHLMMWCDTLLQNKQSAPYIWGIAHHWYEEGEGKYFEPLQEFQRKYQKLPMIAAEQGVFGLYLNDGKPAELYAKDIIGNMNNGSAAWVVWGMALDHKGGPNHAKNFNHSPIMIDVEKQIIHFNPSYYYIAHFSKYVKPGAVRIELENVPPDLLAVAFQNPSGEMIMVALNEKLEEKKIAVNWKGPMWSVTIPAKSIATVKAD